MERITSKLTRALVFTLLLATAVMTANSQEKPKPIDVDALAVRGEAIANSDPLSAELRTRIPEGPSRRGFDIGMAAAEGQTLPGPGKDRLGNSLRRDEQRGFFTAVSFSVERNKNADYAARGARIAMVDTIVAEARTADRDVFYWLGFDIATGIFGDPALGARGNTATGPGSLKVRDSLSAAGQRGFNASMELHLSRNYKPQTRHSIPASGGSGSYDQNAPVTRVGKNSAGADAVIRASRPPSNEILCRGGNGLVFTPENSKPGLAGDTIIIALLTFNPGPYAAGPRGEGLRPLECAWVDRPIFDRFLIRFEISANAQLKQKLHGSEVDTSPTAAETYPDIRSIEIYMRDMNHYWRFVGPKPVNNFLTTTGNGYFKRPPAVVSPADSKIKDRDRVLIPTKP